MKTHDLKKKLENKEDVFILDIREPHEHAETGVVHGSRRVSMGEVLSDPEASRVPKGRAIVCVCRSGRRCRVVADGLAPKGYSVDVLEGGILEWKKEYQTEKI